LQIKRAAQKGISVFLEVVFGARPLLGESGLNFGRGSFGLTDTYRVSDRVTTKVKACLSLVVALSATYLPTQFPPTYQPTSRTYDMGSTSDCAKKNRLRTSDDMHPCTDASIRAAPPCHQHADCRSAIDAQNTAIPVHCVGLQYIMPRGR
jgi:hypothetical protein